MVDRILAASAKYGVRVLGCTYHIMDGFEEKRAAPDFNEPDFLVKLTRRLSHDKRIGAEYVSFQISLPPDYMQTPFAWRDDEEYFNTCVQRVLTLRNLCWQH